MPTAAAPTQASTHTAAASAPVIWAVDASLWRDHPLGRGEFLAAVFSGSRSAIGEIAGQDTWATPLKFSLPDPRRSADDDFARTSGAPLPPWRTEHPEPTPGVCFVLDDDRHPHLAALVARGGREHEHFIVLSRPPARATPESRIDDNLRQLLARATGDGPVVILGYGDQGARVGARLRAVSRSAAHRAVVIDASPQRRLAAQSDGFATADERSVPAGAACAVYTPLARFDNLFGVLVSLERRGVPALRDPRTGRPYLIQRGPYRLDAGAARVLEITDGRLTSRLTGLPLEAAVVRDDLRRIGSCEARHLHGMERFELGEAGVGIDLSGPSRADRLSPATFVRAERAYIGVCGASPSSTAPLGCLAAREFCSQYWPEAIDRIFPTGQDWRSLGRTSFERRLMRSISSRTVGTSLQSWAQQVLLGAVAAHAASAEAPIVEIGCATGGSTALMGCATAPMGPARGAEIYTVDPDPAMESINRFVAQQEGYADRYTPIVSTSDHALTMLAHLRDRCGVVFIDGDHSEAGVARDFDNYAPLTRRGGILLFHDVSARDLGVINVIADRVLPDGRFRLVCLVDTMAVFERCA